MRQSAKLGGAALILSGVLFFARYVLDLLSGPPPATGAEILGWVSANKLELSLVSEVTFFAALCLVPGLVGLYRTLSRVGSSLPAIGCGIIGVVACILSTILVVHGRLVYPIYGITIRDPNTAEFAVSVFYGGMHAVALLMAAATLILSLALRQAGFGKPLIMLGFATVVGDIIWSYPDRIGPALLFGCQLLFAAWFVAVGWQLYGRTEHGAP